MLWLLAFVLWFVVISIDDPVREKSFSNIPVQLINTEELEENEKFVTEARMYHKMDLDFKMICFNTAVMVCEYQEGGYPDFPE